MTVRYTQYNLDEPGKGPTINAIVDADFALHNIHACLALPGGQWTFQITSIDLNEIFWVIQRQLDGRNLLNESLSNWGTYLETVRSHSGDFKPFLKRVLVLAEPYAHGCLAPQARERLAVMRREYRF